jgi:NADH-quinone oxidoreductase subunit D
MSATVEDPRVIEFDVRTDEMLVNMGPQHPSTHGVLRLVLRTDGEMSRSRAAHRLFAVRGGRRTSRRGGGFHTPPDGLSGRMNMNLGWSLAVS